MPSKIIFLTESADVINPINYSDLDIDVYTNPYEAVEAYQQGEGAAIITDYSNREIKENLEDKRPEGLILSADTSDYFGNVADLLEGSYDEELMGENDFGIYGLTPTAVHGIENSPIGVTAAIKDDKGHHPLFYVNEGFEEITGYDRSKSLGRDCNFLQGEGTDQGKVDLIKGALEDEEPVRTTILNYDADGNEFWNELEIWPFEVGNNVAFMGYQREVTERETYKQNLEMVFRILRHDLSNDQVIMEGHLELLKDKLKQEMGELPREVKVIGERLESLDSKVRKLEQMKDSGTLNDDRTIDLYEKVKKIASDYSEQAQSEDFTIDVKDPGREVRIENKAHLDNYFGNIYENSIEHYPEDENNGNIEVSWNFEGDSVEVQVSDNGPGMETEKENWGIGLLTINRIANMQDINMNLENDDGLTVISEIDLVED